VAKIKVVNNNLDQNLNGDFFNSTPSQTIFQFGSFSVTSNFDGRTPIDYTNTLSSFVRSVTLDTMGVNDIQSQILHNYATNAVLNLDKSDLNTFIRFGSAYEFLRVAVETIVTNYPYGLFMNSQISRTGNVTYINYVYDNVSNTSTFDIPVSSINNSYDLVYNYGNVGIPNDIRLKNLNLSYDKYIVWTSLNPDNNKSNIVGFTGSTSGYPFLSIRAVGNPFAMISGTTSSPLDFHLKPNNFIFEEFRALLNQYEKYMVSTRVTGSSAGFKFSLKEPILLDDGNITYSETVLYWSTSDKYNININGSVYQNFLQTILTIGAKYDKIKTDLIARFLTPASIKAYDLTEEGKMTKLLRIYGAEFDQMREFIDSLVYINKVSYNKINNVPDQLIKNLSRTFGWNYFSLVNESELVSSFLTIDENERNLETDLMPAEIDIELWRRILINTNYFWKTKGTREAIRSMFLLIGIPEPFINITEYVYTVDGKINPNTVRLTQSEFPNNSLPYDNSGYPTAPLESPTFFFQISGDTDSGQAYMDNFRNAGFNLKRTIDNKKSWSESGATYRIDDTTPQYFQADSKLVINTKEVDISLDTARGIEYNVYNYIQTDFTANSSGFTLPYSYVNISLGYTGTENTFPLPAGYSSNKVQGDLEVRFNGILLNAPRSGNTSDYNAGADYTINLTNKTFTLTGETGAIYANNNASGRDVIQATFVYSGGTHSLSGVTVDYIVTRVSANVNGTEIILPEFPRGDVQLTVNGIALTKGTPQFTADYLLDPNNTISGTSRVIIQNQDVISYLRINPVVQIAFVKVQGSDDISARSEVVRVDTFNSSKIYYNQGANKYVYKLNYKANSASDVKVLVDGIALEPNTDYSVNVQNAYEVFLPKGIKYGSIISVYYLVGGNSLFKPVVSDVFGIGDISQLSFLEFIELIRRKMINARNRKTISDFKGGWYPSLLRIYMEYMRRSLLPENDPLHSNGYTFANLYPFLSKYNAFFQRFVDELLPATIILRGSGLLIRNTIFTKQKFMYRRGVNLYGEDTTEFDSRGNAMYLYMGEDGSIFRIAQPNEETQPTLYVETIQGIWIESVMKISTGGMNIIGTEILTSYGLEYRKVESGTEPWIGIELNVPLTTNNYSITLADVEYGQTYEYRAIVRSGIYGYTGETLQTIIPLPNVVPEIFTKIGTAGEFSIATGGINIIGWENADYYGMQYRRLGDVGITDITVSPLVLNYSAGGTPQNVEVSGDTWNTTDVVRNPIVSWIVAPTTPIAPSPTGTISTIPVSVNTGAARTGTVCYVPTEGTTKYVTINQSGVTVTNKSVYMCTIGSSGDPQTSPPKIVCGIITGATIGDQMSIGENFALGLCWRRVHETHQGIVTTHSACVTCQSIGYPVGVIYSVNELGSTAAQNITTIIPPFNVKYGDDVRTYVALDSELGDGYTCMEIMSIVSGNGDFIMGTSPIKINT